MVGCDRLQLFVDYIDIYRSIAGIMERGTMVMINFPSSSKKISAALWASSSFTDVLNNVVYDFGCRCCRLSRMQSAFDSYCIATEAFSETQSNAVAYLVH